MLARPWREVCFVSVAVDIGRVRGVSDHHGHPIGPVHVYALMADRVARGGHDADAFRYLTVTVEQLEARAGEIEPLPVGWLLATRAFQLRALDVKRRVLEDGILAAVVEMEMAVDDDLHIGGAQVVLGHRVRRVAVDDLPILDQPLIAPADARVDEDGAGARVLDHEPMHRYVVKGVETRQVEANDLHQGRKGEAANSVKRSAR